jgi:endo-alpha-1,4-polygalactosaminidase (GH114 family)
MEVIQTAKKGRYMDTIEKYHIFKETKKNNHINDKHNIEPNAIFEALLDPHNGK